MLSKKIASVCKQIRKSRNVLLKDFAKLCNVTESTIINFENGKHFNFKLIVNYQLLVGGEENFYNELKKVL